ncbi:GVQW3 protein, partial [Acromyrmex charruanus]
MKKRVEQRVCLKFCVANEISCVNALKMLQKAYGDSSLSKSQVYEWYKLFKEGREIVEDLPRSGRPLTSNTDKNVDKVKKIVLTNRRVSEREIISTLNISNGLVHYILTRALDLRCVQTRLVPKQASLVLCM